MKTFFIVIGTLIFMIAFAWVSYLFSHKQLVSMQKRIDVSWVQIENLQQQSKQAEHDNTVINKRISVLTTQYNSLVKNYNASIKHFPGSFIAENNDLHPRLYFEFKDKKD